MQRIAQLRAALQHLHGRRFAQALADSAPWAGDAEGALLHALALAGTGAVAEAAPLLARIAAASPRRNHPVQELLGLLPLEEGLPHLRAALRLMPDVPRLLGALGALLAEIGPMHEALDAFQRVTVLTPGDAMAWSNWGKALTADGRFTQADTAFGAALRLAPGQPRIAYNRAVMLLKSGRMAEGWPAFAARHALPGRPPPLPGRRLASLDGVAGRTVLLAHDEGFGDTLQFIRYAPLLAARGATVLARMPPPLARLVGGVAGVSGVVSGPALPRYDAWCPLLDLPALFATTVDTVPGGVPYLGADPVRVAGRPAVGVAWAGDPKAPADRSRSLDPALLAPLAGVPGIHWVSLQFGVAPPPWIVGGLRGVADFAGSAAVVAGLDAVVSVDTAIAHLAGGLGRPVILLDRYDNCWRWLHGRTDSPWYPTLRVVRQASPGDWAGVVRDTMALLKDRFGPGQPISGANAPGPHAR